MMSETNAEPRGYLSVCQTADGVIQLISSRQHYAFNLPWVDPSQVKCTLEAKVVGSGTLNPGRGTHVYAYNTEVTVTATPDRGWRFEYWQGDLTGETGTSQQLVMDRDRKVTAVFLDNTPNAYTLNTWVEGKGTMSPSPGTYDVPKMTAVTLVATPDDGWRFDHWDGDHSGTANPDKVGMTSDKNVIAVFVEDDDTGDATINCPGTAVATGSARDALPMASMLLVCWIAARAMARGRNRWMPTRRRR